MSINLDNYLYSNFSHSNFSLKETKDAKINQFLKSWKNEGFKEGYSFDYYGNLERVQGQPTFRAAAAAAAKATDTSYRIFEPTALDKYKDINLDTYLNLLLKRIGHALGLRGFIHLPNNKTLNLEGFCEAYTVPMLASSFEVNSSEFQNMTFNQADIKWLIHQFNQTTCSDLVTKEQIEKMADNLKDPHFEGPLGIGSGYDWHSNMTIFLKNFVLRCDRGLANMPGISIFELPNNEYIKISDLNNLAKRQACTRDFNLVNIKQQWNGKLIYWHEMKTQKTGNCTYANAKAGMLALMAIRFILNSNIDLTKLKDKNTWKKSFEAVRPTYKKWTQSDRNLVLKHFISVVEAHINTQNPQDSSLKYTYMLTLMYIMDKIKNTSKKNGIDSQLSIQSEKLFKILLQDKNLDPSAYDNFAIQLAFSNGDAGVVKELLNNKRVDPTYNNNIAIRSQSEHGNLEVVKELLKHPKVDPSAESNFAIQWASRNGHLEVVKELLNDIRVDPSAENNLAIQWASINGHLEVVKELLKHPKVDPSAKKNFAIEQASANGHLEVVKELLKHPKIDSSIERCYALQWASEHGNIEVVKELLKHPKVDPSAEKNYAFQLAKKNGHLEVLKEIVNHPKYTPFC